MVEAAPKDLPAAARQLVRTTPLVWCAPLSCWLKLESLQTTGSFKLRGATVKLARLAATGGTRVVAASAGNHGMGVAYASRALGMAATVVVPEHAAEVKKRGIATFGAQIVVEGAGYDQAEAHALKLAQESGAPFVSAYDDDDVIAGNGGWLGAELRAQLPSLERVLVPVGGGGMAGGLVGVLDGVELVGIQPRANCAMYESLALGRALTRYDGDPTLCEGLEGAVAERTYQLAKQLSRIALVSEEEVLAAIAFAYRTLGLVMEPSAAVVVAALRNGSVAGGENVAAIVSGGNIDAALLDRALAS